MITAAGGRGRREAAPWELAGAGRTPRPQHPQREPRPVPTLGSHPGLGLRFCRWGCPVCSRGFQPPQDTSAA